MADLLLLTSGSPDNLLLTSGDALLLALDLTPTPTDRSVVVAAESRNLIIPSEARTYTIPAETRSLIAAR